LLFQFGSFVEHAILSTYANETLKSREMAIHEEIIRKYRDLLPIGVFKEWEKLKSTLSANESRQILCAIKEILLSRE